MVEAVARPLVLTVEATFHVVVSMTMRLNCTRKGTNVFVLSGRGGFQQSFGPPAQVLGNYFIFLYAHS